MPSRLGLLLLVSGLIPAGGLHAQPSAPENLVIRAGDRSVILHWDAVTAVDLKGYRVYRAPAPGGPFEQPVPTVFLHPHFVDFDVENGTTYYYRVRAVDTADRESTDSNTAAARPDVLDDDAFLDLVAQTAFDYFWYEANPENGLIRDRNTPTSASSIAAVGFGLSALTVGIDRGWISREAGRARVRTTLEFFWNSPHGPEPDATGYRGFYYHFLDMETGRRAGTTELSTIDTALLMAGILHVRQYFDGDDPDEVAIRALADSLYERVEWDWMQVRGSRIAHGWKPETGFLPWDWGGYNEAMILYLLALGSPTHAVGPEAWTAWTSTYTWATYYGYSFVVFPPLFGHQYSHVWIDFRGIRDGYMRGKGIDYFENSRRATLANRAYAIDNPNGFAGYGEHAWGLTASDGPDGYRARGAPPAQNDDGTLTPTAAGGSMPFAPEVVLPTLRHLYDTYRTRLWGRYGFRDALNPTRGWFASDHLGIDQGPIVLMIENHRTGRVWDVFMQHEAVQRGLERAGFTPVSTGQAPSPEAPGGTRLLPAYPSPATTRAVIPFTLAVPAHVRLRVHDLLGRTVATVVDGTRPAGRHEATLDVAGLPAGVYVYTLTAGAAHATGKLVVY
ncbi:MAG: hypothetical protein KatS3mg044_1277 [Rhodothermaceae bacterium]|nr:MAG: hypothetical protein KatS3mg044_1277 [Rhodothermaceae bacterium]